MLIITLSVDSPQILLTTILFLPHLELFKYLWLDLQFETECQMGTSSLVPHYSQPQQTHPSLKVNVCDDDERCTFLSHAFSLENLVIGITTYISAE